MGVAQKKDGGKGEGRKKNGASNSGEVSQRGSDGKGDAGHRHDAQPRSTPSSKAVPQFDGAGVS